MSRIREVDAYIAKSAEFAQPILEYLRDIVHEATPDAVEEMKWSRPFFVCKGVSGDVILGNISAFKAHCSFGLWGVEIAESLRAEGANSAGGMGSFGKITSVKDLPARKKLLELVGIAANAIATGERAKSYSRPQRVAKPMAVVPEELAAALKKDKAATDKFAAMSPSCQREYCEWIGGSKREETRVKRVATAMEWIGEGKSRNWKYERAK